MNSDLRRLEDTAQLLLLLGSKLMTSGASTERVRITVERMALALSCDADLLITHRALSITIKNPITGNSFSSLLRTPPHGVNFSLVSGISILSWSAVKESWDIEKIRVELSRLEALPKYPRVVVLLMVSIAGASFCRIFGGNWVEMLSTFVATFIGLFALQEARTFRFNGYLCVLFASASASIISGIVYSLGLSDTMEHCFAASVLFLIPGVPLINALTDMIDGNILNGIVRGVHAFLIIFMVAIGLMLAMLLYRI